MARDDMYNHLLKMKMHGDAADCGYGSTLGSNPVAVPPSSCVAQGFWKTEERSTSITLWELRTIRLLLHHSSSEYISNRQVSSLLILEDNHAVVCVLNAMVLASRPMMSELRKLRTLLHVFGVQLDARWIPSAVTSTATRSREPGTRSP